MNVMRQTACLVVNPITVNNFNCSSSNLMMIPTIKLSIKVVGRAHQGSTVGFLLLKHFSMQSRVQARGQLGRKTRPDGVNFVLEDLGTKKTLPNICSFCKSRYFYWQLY